MRVFDKVSCERKISCVSAVVIRYLAFYKLLDLAFLSSNILPSAGRPKARSLIKALIYIESEKLRHLPKIGQITWKITKPSTKTLTETFEQVWQQKTTLWPPNIPVLGRNTSTTKWHFKKWIWNGPKMNLKWT